MASWPTLRVCVPQRRHSLYQQPQQASNTTRPRRHRGGHDTVDTHARGHGTTALESVPPKCHLDQCKRWHFHSPREPPWHQDCLLVPPTASLASSLDGRTTNCSCQLKLPSPRLRQRSSSRATQLTTRAEGRSARPKATEQRGFGRLATTRRTHSTLAAPNPLTK